MAGFTASWVHGNAVVQELTQIEDGAVLSFVHYGWGTQIRMRPGFSRWFHIPLPTPVMLDGYRMKLIRAFIHIRHIGAVQFEIRDVHLYDGPHRVAAQSAGDFTAPPSVSIPDCQVYELFEPRVCAFGAGLSFNLAGIVSFDGLVVDERSNPWIVVSSAGADFQIRVAQGC